MRFSHAAVIIAVTVSPLLVSGPAHAWHEMTNPRARFRAMPQTWQLDENRCDSAVGGPGVSVAESTLQTAIGRWNAVGSGWKGLYGGRTSTSTQGDRKNQLWFLRRWDPALGDRNGVLAVAEITAGGSGPVFTIAECDVIFNGDVFEWTTGEARRRDGFAIGQMTMLSTTLHELGHCHGLEHSDRNNAVMTAARGIPYDTPQPDDRDGALALYPPGAPLCIDDEQCLAASRCQNGMCEVVPPGELGTDCDYNEDCTEGLECRGFCTRDCSSDDDCSAWTFCERYLGGIEYCTPNGPGKLGEACTYRSDCESTLCVYGACVQPCVDNDCACPIGKFCEPLPSAFAKPAYCTDGESTCVRCGDGKIGGDEACDDGEENDDLSKDRCRTDCRPARCGDGVVDTGEECDTGNTSTACKAPCEPVEPPKEASPDPADAGEPTSNPLIPSDDSGGCNTAGGVRLEPPIGLAVGIAGMIARSRRNRRTSR